MYWYHIKCKIYSLLVVLDTNHLGEIASILKLITGNKVLARLVILFLTASLHIEFQDYSTKIKFCILNSANYASSA